MKTYGLEGQFTIDSKKLHEGKDFFRKMTENKKEIELCKFIMNHPHKNIVKIYNIGDDYIDMELLNADIEEEDMGKVEKEMKEVKTYLQKLGFMYIDWKLDNIGKSKDGQFKLFDFNVSGRIDKETNKWIIKPFEGWSYRKAIGAGKNEPVDIDNYAFNLGFTKESELNHYWFKDREGEGLPGK